MAVSTTLLFLHVSDSCWSNTSPSAPPVASPYMKYPVIFSGHKGKPSLLSSRRQPTPTPNVGNCCNDTVLATLSPRKKMLPEKGKHSAAQSKDVDELNFKETELTLALPGESRGIKTGAKRGFSETVDLNLGRATSPVSEQSENKSPAPNAQMVGWPPVRGSRKNVMRSCNYVKVAVDGAPYLRKVDLQVYESYEQLLKALETMFSCLTIRDSNERKIVDSGNGVEYMPTYEDKDGDWMLVGDVPWKMFAESCRRIRLMISSEATGLAPRTPSMGKSSS